MRPVKVLLVHLYWSRVQQLVPSQILMEILSFQNVEKGAVIQVSFVGYSTKEVIWKGTPISVVLEDDTKTLEEVVVVGYGTQKSKLTRFCSIGVKVMYWKTDL